MRARRCEVDWASDDVDWRCRELHARPDMLRAPTGEVEWGRCKVHARTRAVR